MLTNEQVSVVKGLLAQGQKQHDIAAWFGVNAGRIADISAGRVGADIKPASGNLPNVRPMRHFVPSTPLQQQIEILDNLIATAPSDSARIYTITPDLAEHILRYRNGTNRRPSAGKISEYVDAMRLKRWPVTGASIVFSKSGFLMDGQHRLMAAVQAKVPLTTFIAFNIDDGAFAMIDIGRRRNNVDAFTIARIKEPNPTAKACRWLLVHQNNPTDRGLSYTNDQLYDYFTKKVDQGLMHECVLLALEIERTTKQLATGKTRNYIPAGATAALLYLFAQKNKRHMLAFAQEMISYHGHGRAVVKNIKDRIDNNVGRIHDVVRNALIVQAWNAYRNDVRPSKAIFTWTLSEEYPTID